MATSSPHNVTAQSGVIGPPEPMNTETSKHSECRRPDRNWVQCTAYANRPRELSFHCTSEGSACESTAFIEVNRAYPLHRRQVGIHHIHVERGSPPNDFVLCIPTYLQKYLGTYLSTIHRSSRRGNLAPVRPRLDCAPTIGTCQAPDVGSKYAHRHRDTVHHQILEHRVVDIGSHH